MSCGIAGAADRHRRRAQGDQPLGIRSQIRAANARRIGRPTLRCRQGHHHSAAGRSILCAEAYGFSQEFIDYVRTVPIQPERGSVIGRALLEGRVIHIPDVEADPEYTFTEAQRLGGFRTILGVPMLRDGAALGVLALTRSEVRPFTDKQIELSTLRRSGGDCDRERPPVR